VRRRFTCPFWPFGETTIFIRAILGAMSSSTSRAEESDSDLKFGRAKKLLEDLEVARRKYLSDNPFQPLLESDSMEWNWRLNIVTPPPADLTLICGDIIHNLRSALEYRVMVIAKNVLGTPLSKAQEKTLTFPAIGHEADFNYRIRDWDEVLSPRAADIAQCVRVFQPFATPSRYLDYLGEENIEIKSEQKAIFERLHRLKWLSNTDKHRRLHLLFASLAGSSMTGISEPERFRRRPNPLAHGAIITTLPLEAAPDLTPEQVHLNLELRLERPYSEFEPTPIEGSFDFYAELEGIAWYVGEALKILEYEENRILSS
jgi:hypothetical protein